ncbi:RNA 2'-phosphotransferase [Janthinobacterium sp. HH103]|uniref:RNA 2'-phosphotransferase n=1 Tax=unclassified Janthinobacterium TaxID=2610881 RepID=UPI000875A447|nr:MULTISPECIES: RNA 2'-phosphotransferase [unclassified Janthinobacterium]OEZ72685.1 RNA 2'-phosphotransferase [Janthinobacterium sp. HH100]OEZ86815.1 RNA 2'-phosphotransferase [Janthinobacterium sp. HH103]QOU73921.1 RNA 2'-phosphotransferase [Janthinobacterium sp. HH102]
MSNHLVQTSKFLSLILRHSPEKIGLALDAQGWADIGQLLAQAASHGRSISREQLDEVVARDSKTRYAISDDGLRIRANQGHSLAAVDIALPPATPPAMLYHGTASRFVAAIRAGGLLPGARNHVHLSSSRETAVAVGARHGKPVVLTVDAAAMQAQGHVFYVSDNGVWLTQAVPRAFIGFP